MHTGLKRMCDEIFHEGYPHMLRVQLLSLCEFSFRIDNDQQRATIAAAAYTVSLSLWAWAQWALPVRWKHANDMVSGPTVTNGSVIVVEVEKLLSACKPGTTHYLALPPDLRAVLDTRAETLKMALKTAPHVISMESLMESIRALPPSETVQDVLIKVNGLKQELAESNVCLTQAAQEFRYEEAARWKERIDTIDHKIN